MEANNKVSPTVTELFLRGRKPTILFLYHNLISKFLNYKTKCDISFDHENT